MAGPAYELLPTTGDSEADAAPPPKRRRPPVWIFIAGAVFLLLAVFGLARPPPQLEQTSNGHGATKRVYLRVGELGIDGFGSALQHFKQSIVLAGALDSELILAAQESEHHYSTSRIFNTNSPASDAAADVRNACRIKDHVPPEQRDRLVRGLCAGDRAAAEAMEKIRTEMAACTGIVDMDEDEITQDLNGCIMAWVRQRLLLLPAMAQPLAPPPPNEERPVTVGVHVRWGDTAGKFGTGFRGSMGVPNIARVLRDIRGGELGRRGVRLRIAMERADKDVLARLNETDYELLDSGDALADLRAISKSDVLLLGESSYGVVAHLIAPPGLTVVELAGNYHKYDNTSGFGREVVYIDDDYAPEKLQLPHRT
ncbi:hypothetical protein FB451DRAFT_1558684 [Mycena latifolia]|nr:hypothetical protein FB451DRAFT_1558684 [Mycena latifolia]